MLMMATIALMIVNIKAKEEFNLAIEELEDPTRLHWSSGPWSIHAPHSPTV